MPRPSLVADPITAFGKRKPAGEEREARKDASTVMRIRNEIKPKPLSSLPPLTVYKSPRDLTRDKVFNEIHRQQMLRESGGVRSYMTDNQSLDLLLPRVHGKSQITSDRLTRGPIF